MQCTNNSNKISIIYNDFSLTASSLEGRSNISNFIVEYKKIDLESNYIIRAKNPNQDVDAI